MNKKEGWWVNLEYIIGIDGGGTKTEAIAYDILGNELCRAYTGFGNLSVKKDVAIKNIIESINEVQNKLKSNNCVYICLGLAGVESGNNKETIEREITKRFNTNVLALNDADIALAALLKGQDGVLTISGTGSICYGKHKDRSERSGGWGHLIGDEGSGYYISIEAIKKMALDYDNNEPISNLSHSILKHLNLNNPEEIKGFVYNSSKAEIAALAPVVVKCANENDVYAKGILYNSGMELAKCTERVCNKLEINEGFKVGIKGSILTKVNNVRSVFESYLKSKFKNIEIINEDISPAKGSYYIALKNLK